MMIVIVFNATNTWLLDFSSDFSNGIKLKEVSFGRKTKPLLIGVRILNGSWISNFRLSYVIRFLMKLPFVRGWREDSPKSNVALQFRWVVDGLWWWCLKNLSNNLNGFLCMLGMEFEGRKRSKLELYESSSIPLCFMTWFNRTISKGLEKRK